MMNKNEICSKCKFWTVEDEEHRAWGTCQRYPDNKSKFPHDWCGEWQAWEEEITPKRTSCMGCPYYHKVVTGYAPDSYVCVAEELPEDCWKTWPRPEVAESAEALKRQLDECETILAGYEDQAREERRLDEEALKAREEKESTKEKRATCWQCQWCDSWNPVAYSKCSVCIRPRHTRP